MADIVETTAALDGNNNWTEGIYQLEQADVVLGGADGIDNLQAKQLLARINFLKALALSLGNDKQPVDALLTALAALVTSADKTLYFTGPDAPALAPLTAYGRSLIAAADATAARVVLDAASPADVAAAVAGLVNSSPAALDTLNELAAALGNDANFAATITAALGLKAPLASPAFTGTPTAPTPAQFDSSQKVATMEAVQRALGSCAGWINVGANNVQLTAAAVGKRHNLSSSALSTNAPSLADVSIGSSIHFKNTGGPAALCAVNAIGVDTILVSNISVATIVVENGEWLTITKISAGSWEAVGSAVLKYAASFGATLAVAGNQKLPSGLIRKWGLVNNIPANDQSLVTFPVAFPNEALGVLLGSNSSNSTTTKSWYSLSTTGFALRNDSSYSTTSCFWEALGR